MPVKKKQPRYKNYKKEYANETPARKKARVERNKARRLAIKQGKAKVGDDKHVHHKKPIRSGGKTTKKNIAVRSASSNSKDQGKRKGVKQKKWRK